MQESVTEVVLRQAPLLALLVGCVVLHVRLRLWSSASLLASCLGATAWFWVDASAPYWSADELPILKSGFDAVYAVAPFTGAVLLLWFGVSFLVVALVVPGRVGVQRSDV